MIMFNISMKNPMHDSLSFCAASAVVIIIIIIILRH